MTEETARIDCQPPRLADGLTDDYEYWHGELPEALHMDKTALYAPDPQNFEVEWISRPTQEVPDRSRFC